jgi:hypothetical protein
MKKMMRAAWMPVRTAIRICEIAFKVEQLSAGGSHSCAVKEVGVAPHGDMLIVHDGFFGHRRSPSLL